MYKLSVLVFILVFNALANNCERLYFDRGEGIDKLEEAIECYKSTKEKNQLLELKRLNSLSYLYFFKSMFYGKNKESSLIKSYNFAKDSINKYGTMFNTAPIRNLPKEEKSQVARAYYLYGTAVSQYIELKGKWVAIKRMSEITKSMTSVLRLRLPETFYYGAYRTLAIFNLKVPKVAGGSLAKSKSFFEKLMKESLNGLGVSSYPVGHYFYAEYLYRVSRKNDACSELQKVIDIKDKEIYEFFPDLIPETFKDRENAIKKFEEYNC